MDVEKLKRVLNEELQKQEPGMMGQLYVDGKKDMCRLILLYIEQESKDSE